MWEADKIYWQGVTGWDRAYSGDTLIWQASGDTGGTGISLLDLWTTGETHSYAGYGPVYCIPQDVTAIYPDTYDWSGIVNVFSRFEVGMWGSVRNSPTVSFLYSGPPSDWDDGNVSYIDISIPDTESISYFTGADNHTKINPVEYIRLRDTGKIYSWQKAFTGCLHLTGVTIETLSGATYVGEQKEFEGCTALTQVSIGALPNRNMSNIGFDDCPLTHDSIVGLLNALPQTTSNYSFQLGSTNIAKLTDDEKAIATNKGWKLT